MLVAGRYVHPNSLFARLSKITDYRLTRYYHCLSWHQSAVRDR